MATVRVEANVMFASIVQIQSDGKVDDDGVVVRLLAKASIVAVLLQERATPQLLQKLTRLIGQSPIEMCCVWGIDVDWFHDEVDHVSIAWRSGNGPTTTLDRGSREDFLWNICYAYRGLVEVTPEKWLLALSVGGDDATLAAVRDALSGAGDKIEEVLD